MNSMTMKAWPPISADLVNRADVRMVERRRGARLFEQLRRGEFRGRILQPLDRDGPVQPRIVRAVHHTHGSGTELGVDAVVTEQPPIMAPGL